MKPTQPHSKSNKAARSQWAHETTWEQCERRLALSAMPWMPWDPTLHDVSQASVANAPVSGCDALDTSAHFPTSEVSVPQPNVQPPIEPQLSEAHSQTGWNQAQTQYGMTGKGQTVAVIDSGIAFDHVALGKGFGPGYRVVGGWDFAENDARPYDDAPAGFHGTHVAGIVGANNADHLGVAPNVDLVALRVFNDAGRGDVAWTENALKWVHEHRNSFANPITTVNLSLGSAWNSSTVPSWGTFEDELAQLQRDGIVVVASAGNAFQQNKTPGLSYPAASPYVIPVSSIDANGQLSDFSQRDARIIAAPGRSIESAVPDYFYGKDGIANDWSTASGTSMAAPYIAGASVLVREAMELVGVQNITPQSIYEHLKSTSHTIWDNITKQNYQSLDLDRAIESLIPVDTVGDSFASGQLTSIQNTWQTNGWINSLTDSDVYRLAPVQNGTISVDLTSDTVDDAVFNLLRGTETTPIKATNGRLSFSVQAGEAIGLSVADTDSIGSYHLNWNYQATANSDDGKANPSTAAVDLGSIDLLEKSLSGMTRYRMTADHTGILSVVADAGLQTSGTLQVFRPGIANGTLTDSTLEANQWRIDLDVTQGQSIEFVLPGNASRNVHLVNLVQLQNDAVTILGTDGADSVKIDLSSGIVAGVGGIDYRFDSSTTKSIAVDGQINNDSLTLIGSAQTDRVEMRPGLTTLDNAQLSLRASHFELVTFGGGGGSDQTTLFDAATDDRLNIWPTKAEMTGVGYTFKVDQVERLFVQAVQGGDDQAFVFDSMGNDSLSVRPQFTSLRGDGYFNFVAGFERVFAYSTAGGVDNASLYDSAGNDLFSASSEGASIVGPGFSTFAKGFEKVEAYASAGGVDRAVIVAPAYGKGTSGPDFAGIQDTNLSVVARHFERVESSVAVASANGSVLKNSLAMIEDSIELSSNSIESAPVSAPIDIPVVGQISASSGASQHPTSSAAAIDTNEQLLDHLEQINDWVANEMRSQRNGTWQNTNAFDEAKPYDSRLDLSWADAAKERAALDEIFSRHI